MMTGAHVAHLKRLVSDKLDARKTKTVPFSEVVAHVTDSGYSMCDKEMFTDWLAGHGLAGNIDFQK